MSARVMGALSALCLLVSSAEALADPPPAPPPPPIRSEGMLRGGVVLTFVGGIGAATGGVLLLASSFGCPDRCEDSASRSRALGGTMLGIGGAALAAGIVLIVMGNQKMPKEPKAALLRQARNPGLLFTF